MGVVAFASQWLLSARSSAYVALQVWLPDAIVTQMFARLVGSFSVLVG